jgi:hypothetical protein
MGGRAANLLTWTWRGSLLEAAISRARYFITAERHEVPARAEVRELDGRQRVDVGSFPTVALAQAACERNAQRRCRRDVAAGAVATCYGRRSDLAWTSIDVATSRAGGLHGAQTHSSH